MIKVANKEMPDARSALRAIRLKCMDCCCGSSNEVDLCTVDDCPLYSRRKGHNPIKRIMSEENRIKAVERMKNWQKKKIGL